MFQSKNKFSQKIVSLVSTIMGVGSTLLLTNVASASTLKVEVTNVGPVNGMALAQTWFGIHDGSFDLFDAGEAASRPIEILAEDGFPGLEARVPGVVDIIQRINLNLPAVSPELQDAIDNGEDLSTFIPDNTIAGEFNSIAAANGGVQDILFPFSASPRFFILLQSGESLSKTVHVDDPSTNRFFSYAAMLFPTNDAFIANDDPEEIEIFDDRGNFIGADILISGDQVWDGGTEVNDERQDSAPFLPQFFGITQEEENGVIHPFPRNSFKLPGEGGFVDFEFPPGTQFFENADFTRQTAPLFRVRVTQVVVPEPNSAKSLLAVGSLFLFGAVGRWFKRYR